METSWKGRRYKTEQDRMAHGQRPRAQEWDRRIAWAQKNKPRRSGDWNAYKNR